MGLKLQIELDRHGCDVSPEDFEATLLEVLQALYPGWGSNELEKEPDCGVIFCQAIRHRVGCPTLPQRFIMTRLANLRKSKREEVAF